MYTVKVTVNPIGDISKAVCGYPAVEEGPCHLASTLFAAEDKRNDAFSVANTASAVSPQGSSLPCTS